MGSLVTISDISITTEVQMVNDSESDESWYSDQWRDHGLNRDYRRESLSEWHDVGNYIPHKAMVQAENQWLRGRRSKPSEYMVGVMRETYDARISGIKLL